MADDYLRILNNLQNEINRTEQGSTTARERLPDYRSRLRELEYKIWLKPDDYIRQHGDLKDWLKRALRAERWNCVDAVLWQPEKGGAYRMLTAEDAADVPLARPGMLRYPEAAGAPDGRERVPDRHGQRACHRRCWDDCGAHR